MLHRCDATGFTTIAGFDRRFPLTQSLFNWHQDLEMELGNPGLDEPAKSRARIEVGEEILRRFTDCDQLGSRIGVGPSPRRGSSSGKPPGRRHRQLAAAGT